MEEKDDFEEDEEVSIDFRKVKGLFGRGKKKEEKKLMESERKETTLESEEGVKKERKEREIKKEKKREEAAKEEKEGSEEDEDISVDFSRIKGFFKKKEEPEKQKKESSEEEKEEEVSVDFSKVKNLFKRKKSFDKGVEDGPEDEVSVDVKRVFGFFSKNKRVIIPLVLILIAMFLATYVRLQPAYLPITDSWAKNSVYDYFRSQIRVEIDKQYPNLPEQNKNILVDKEFDNFLKQNKDAVEGQIKQTSDYFKSQLQDENGQTYLVGLDPYFWLRHSENILKNGHPGDILKDGKPYDDHMVAPLGRFVPEDMFHAYFMAYLFKFLHFFNPDLTLVKLVFYVPILLMSLTVIPAFFIARRIGGNVGGFIAAVIVAVHPAILTRTTGGFADTDAYTILLPLMITWFFLIAFETEEIKKRVICSSLAGFFIGIFAFSWGGWWYIFDFILAAGAMYLIYYAIAHRKEFRKRDVLKHPAIKNTLFVMALFIVSSGIFTTIFVDFDAFRSAPLSPIGFIKLKQVAITTVWPNVYTTVAEQNPASLDSVISQVGFGGKSGGKFFLSVAIIGIILTLFKKDRFGKSDVKYAILLSLWLIATIYASTKGIRYAQLIIPAFCVSFGVALGLAHQLISKWASKELNVNKLLVDSVLIVLITLLFLVGPVKASMDAGMMTDMNDAWYNSLKKIDQEAAPNAIINSWWDFGHWFKSIGNRPVTFDGTSQNLPQAHWIGKVLLTDDENLAIGILRMLDCGANNAFNELDSVIRDPAASVDILNKIIVLDKSGAKKILFGYNLTPEEAESVLRYTHCEPPEDYFITSNDMVQKSGVWAHFGSWNFERATIYNTLEKPEYKGNMEKSIEFLQTRFNYTEDGAKETYFTVQSFSKGGKEVNDWIAPWPGYASGLNGCRKSGEAVTCSIPQGGQAIINLTTMQANVPTAEGVMHPNSLVYVTKEGVFEKKFNQTIGLSIVLVPSGDGFANILTSPQLANSMFTRLFFLKGHGLHHFKLFSYERSNVGGSEIYVWKVDWKGGEKNVAEEFFPKPKEEAPVNKTITNETAELVDLNETEEIKNNSNAS